MTTYTLIQIYHHCRVKKTAEGTNSVSFKLFWLYVLDWCCGCTVVIEVSNVLMSVFGSNSQYRAWLVSRWYRSIVTRRSFKGLELIWGRHWHWIGIASAGWANAQKTGKGDPPASLPHQQNFRRYTYCCVQVVLYVLDWCSGGTVYLNLRMF